MSRRWSSAQALAAPSTAWSAANCGLSGQRKSNLSSPCSCCSRACLSYRLNGRIAGPGIATPALFKQRSTSTMSSSVRPSSITVKSTTGRTPLPCWYSRHRGRLRPWRRSRDGRQPVLVQLSPTRRRPMSLPCVLDMAHPQIRSSDNCSGGPVEHLAGTGARTVLRVSEERPRCTPDSEEHKGPKSALNANRLVGEVRVGWTRRVGSPRREVRTRIDTRSATRSRCTAVCVYRPPASRGARARASQRCCPR